MDSVIAIDLGGTKLRAAVVDRDGTVLWRKKLPAAAGNPAATIERTVQVIHEAETALPASPHGRRPVGIIVPGIYFAGTGNVWAPNLWGHDEAPLRTELEDRLKLPIVVEQRPRRVRSRRTMARRRPRLERCCVPCRRNRHWRGHRRWRAIASWALRYCGSCWLVCFEPNSI